jgi:flagellar basal body rod protein FlgG
MVAARTRLQIATENLANVSTDGFRRVLARGFLTANGVTVAREPARDQGTLRADAFARLPPPHLSNGVDAVAEMIDVLVAERSFESAQKAVAAIDLTRQKSAEAARIT